MSRSGSYLRHRYRLILSYVALLMIAGGVLVLFPLIYLFWYPSTKAVIFGFALPAGSLIILGGVLYLLTRGKSQKPLNLSEGGIVVLLSWVSLSFFSAIPFVIAEELTWIQALFESVSGWTTTGLSVVDVTSTSAPILLWRSFMQLLGGAGLAILMLSTLTFSGGSTLSQAEGRQQIVPHVRASAQLVMRMYLAYLTVGITGYILVGVPVFDAINHTMSAISTGGFSTQVNSIGHWDSIAVEAVTIPLMLLGGLNFVTAWALFNGRLKVVSREIEVRTTAFLLVSGIATLFVVASGSIYPHLTKSVRVAIFETVTAITTTGYSTMDYSLWTNSGIFIIIIFMIIGGGTCSTAGGVKQYRVSILIKGIWWEIKRILLPDHAVMDRRVQIGEKSNLVNSEYLHQISIYVVLYLGTLSIGVFLMTAYGNSISNALFEYASTLGTVGLSIGITGPDTPTVILISQIVGMLLGRLEFYVILASLIKLGQDFPKVLVRSI